VEVVAQKAIKRIGRVLGLEIRYAFQYPSIQDGRVYDKWLPRDQVRVIFDVGANVGQSASSMLREFPEAKIFSFEPYPATFRRLKTVAGANADRMSAYELACGDTDGTLDIFGDPDSTSGLNRLDGARGGTKSRLPIEMVRLDSFCTKHGISRIDLLKSDTEGFDAKVLAGAERMLAEGRVRCVIAEVGFPNDRTHTPFVEVYNQLVPRGFELVGIYEISYRRDLSVDFANALFVNRGSEQEWTSGRVPA
jgi:FkbM family methyltransferase